MEKIAKFIGMCPNCGGDIYSDRLLMGLPCRKCLPEVPEWYKGDLYSRMRIAQLLKKEGKLKNYFNRIKILLEVEEVVKFFEEHTGKRLWSAQRTWAKRLLLGQSFAISAPTGVGKTFFGSFISLYFATKGKRTLTPSFLPTSSILE